MIHHQQKQKQQHYYSVWTPHNPPQLPHSNQSHCQEPCCLLANPTHLHDLPFTCGTVMEMLPVWKSMCMLRTGLKSSLHRLYSHTKESKNVSISPDSDPFSCVAAFVGRQVCSLGIMLCTVINTIPYFTSKPFRVLQKGQAVYSTMLSCLGSGPLCKNR